MSDWATMNEAERLWDELASARARLAQVEAERDEARAELTALMAKTITHPMAVVVEQETAEQIAAWLDRRHENGNRAGTTAEDYLFNVARDIRAGLWRTP